MSALLSSGLTFSRDGRTLVITDHDGVAIWDTQSATTSRIAVAHARAAIGFVDRVWVAHGAEPVLTRYTRDGRAVGEPIALPACDGTLVPAAVGAPAAVWTASPALAVVEDGDDLDLLPTPRQAEIAIALTGRRWVTASGARVVAPSGVSCELEPGSRVVAMAIVFDGSAVLVVNERGTTRELVVVGLSSGRIQRRHLVAPVPMRIASRRGLVALQIAPRQLGVLDLRTGVLQGEVVCDRDIDDFALDPGGYQLATRSGATLDVVGLREAYARAMPVDEVDEPEERNEPIIAAPTPIAVLAPKPRRISALDVRALAPIVQTTPLARDAALAVLDRETRTVALRTLCAIAEAWDSRRIGYGNEGRHPFEHEVAALLGMNAKYASEHVTAARSHLRAHEATLAGDERGPTTPLGALVSELGLSPLAADILMVAAAPALRSETARLYGILANDPNRALLDEALVEQILGACTTRHELAAELDPRAPLVRLSVISVDPAGTRPFAKLVIDPIVLARLRGEAPDLGAGLTARGSDRALEDLALAPGVIDDALDALARCAGPARIALRGRPGSGRRTLLAALAAEAGRPLGVLDVALLPRGDQGIAPGLHLALRRAQLAGLMPCVIGLEDIAFGDRDRRESIVEVLRAHPGPLAVVLPTGETAPLDPGHIAIDLPLLAETTRLDVWSGALADAGLVADPAALGARYRIGPGAIHRAVVSTIERTRDRERGTDVTHEVDRFIRQTRDARLGAHARRVERLASWDNLVLPPDILDSLHELVARVCHRRTVFETWGMDRTMATSRGLTALFSGPPGTGKTLAAGVIARELGLDLYQVDLSKLMSKWIGETERNLASIFDAAEDGQVILLFDEADSLFAKRTEVRSSNDRYANLEVNYLLQRLDAFEGIAILTTNANNTIDQAFKRRLSFRLTFPFPDEETREELWRAHLPRELPIAGPLALDKLARKYTLSGGYIRNACLRAAFLAAQDERCVSQQHLERAVALEFAELGKLSTRGALA